MLALVTRKKLREVTPTGFGLPCGWVRCYRQVTPHRGFRDSADLRLAPPGNYMRLVSLKLRWKNCGQSTG